MASTSPIAVLDSGAGGLSVVAAMRRLMPNEEIHYFADTAHLPYGIKSPELIKFLALRMAKRLCSLSSCKILVIACHTISTWCRAAIESECSVPVVGMVEPAIVGLKQMLLSNENLSTAGIISTKATLISRVYRDAWPDLDPRRRITLTEHAAGPLVGLVEDPDIPISSITSLVDQSLPQIIKESDALLLGCTHFSALIPVLKAVLNPGCIIVDAAEMAANAVRDRLREMGEINLEHCGRKITAYVSDNPERFQIIARRFIEEDLLIEWLREYARI